MMKPTIIKTAIATLILTQSCGTSKQANSSAGPEQQYYSRNLTPVIDGKMNEWGDKLSYDNSTKCIYSVANDLSSLYICIKTPDRMQQMKIIQGGMEIWIDGKAKKNKSMGIKFPLGGGAMPMPTNRNSEPDPKEMRKQARAQMLTMELTGFKEGLNGLQSVYSNVQVRPVIEWDDNDNLIYELAIPFTAMEETTAANLKNISIGIFINGLKLPDMSSGMPSGGPGGMPPPGGMRPPGGSNMPDQNQMENITKINSFWTKYTISK